MIIVEFKKLHFVFAVRAFQRVIAERKEDGISPLIETTIDTVLVFGNGTIKFGINLAVSGI